MGSVGRTLSTLDGRTTMSETAPRTDPEGEINRINVNKIGRTGTLELWEDAAHMLTIVETDMRIPVSVIGIPNEDRPAVAFALLGGITDELLDNLVTAVHRHVDYGMLEFDDDGALRDVRMILEAAFGIEPTP
jgi:hypothetical protein